MPKKHTLCVVIPAYNEEAVIAASLNALTKIIPKEHIYLVSDGSNDTTVAIARKHIPNVLGLRKNRGKATALKQLLDKHNLPNRYKYTLFTDADSRLSPKFLQEVKQYMRQKPACIVGTVASHRHGMISAYRTYEYSLSQRVYKQAQHTLGTILVAPGCASLYRGDVLSKLDFTHNTLTEDFDLTLQIHVNKLGKIVYVPQARVTTQDPSTLLDYWRQILRWATGTWQNIFLHRLYIPNSKLSALFYIIYFELTLAILSLIFAVERPQLLIHFIIWQYIAITILAIIFLYFERAWWAIRYIPYFPVFYFMNLIVQPVSIARAVIGTKGQLLWHKPTRYQI